MALAATTSWLTALRARSASSALTSALATAVRARALYSSSGDRLGERAGLVGVAGLGKRLDHSDQGIASRIVAADRVGHPAGLGSVARLGEHLATSSKR
jgi:hypothetical protein